MNYKSSITEISLKFPHNNLSQIQNRIQFSKKKEAIAYPLFNSRFHNFNKKQMNYFYSFLIAFSVALQGVSGNEHVLVLDEHRLMNFHVINSNSNSILSYPSPSLRGVIVDEGISFLHLNN